MIVKYELYLEYEAHICFRRAMGWSYETFASYIARRQ